MPALSTFNDGDWVTQNGVDDYSAATEGPGAFEIISVANRQLRPYQTPVINAGVYKGYVTPLPAVGDTDYKQYDTITLTDNRLMYAREANGSWTLLTDTSFDIPGVTPVPDFPATPIDNQIHFSVGNRYWNDPVNGWTLVDSSISPDSDELQTIGTYGVYFPENQAFIRSFDNKLLSLPVPSDTPPVVGTMDFIKWKDQQIAYNMVQAMSWMNNPDVTKYYIDATGGDDGDDGLTPETAWQTVGKVNTHLNAAGNDDKIIYAFKRGEVWNITGTANAVSPGTSALFVKAAKNYTGFMDYGDLDKKLPSFERFQTTLTSGWTLVSGSTYSQVLSGATVSSVRIGDRTPFFDAADSTAVATIIAETDGSYFFDSGTETLYVTLASGADPATVSLKVVENNTESFLILQGDKCFADSLRGYGWGLSTANTATQSHFIRIDGATGKTAAVQNCETLWCSSHAFAQLKGSGTGGIAVFANCFAGFVNFNGVNSETVYNGYAQNGGHTFLTQNCTAWGTLPSHDWYVANDIEIRGTSGLTHIEAGQSPLKLCIMDRQDAPDVPWGCAVPGYGNGGPTVTQRADVRVFIIGGRYENSRPGGRLNYLHGASGHRINEYIRYKLFNFTAQAWTNFSHNNEHIGCLNCRFDFEDSLMATAATIAPINDGANAAQNVWFEHCDFVFRTTDTAHNYRFPSRDDAVGNTRVYNCLFAFYTPSGTDVHFTTSPRMIIDGSMADFNAYYYETSAATEETLGEGTTYDITDGNLAKCNGIPDWGDVSFRGGTNLGVEYDRLERPRNIFTPNVGDLEQYYDRV